MRKNRVRSNRLSVFETGAFHFGAVIVMLAVMVVFNILSSTHCQALQKEIGEREKQLKEVEKELVRVSAAWESMKSVDKLERALVSNGMAMRFAKPDQVVKMQTNGKPRPGLAVAKARERNALSTLAYQEPVMAVPRTTSSGLKRRTSFRKQR